MVIIEVPSSVAVHRVLITAVDKSTTDLNLRLFNNCFNDEYSNGIKNCNVNC